MDNGQRLSALHHVNFCKQHLLDQLITKFAGPQLVNNFGIILEPTFLQYRDACRIAVLADLTSEDSYNVLQAQWEMHTKVRAKFVQALSKLSPHSGQAPTKPYRDTAKEFIVFIKGAQAGYNTLLRGINDKCPDISILGSIAGSYLNGSNSGTSAPQLASNSRVYTVPDDKNAALAITRDSLIYLGDLSRWRHKAHVERQNPTPQWQKARLYYELAHEVDPDSGMAKHQLFVLAQDDNKWFPALALLYQSLASAYPHPQAINNVEMLLTRRLTGPIDQLIKKVKPSNEEIPVVGTIRAWFLQLHVCFYRGLPFENHDEMESEVLTRLGQALKDDTDLDHTLLSMALTNIAAEYVALENAKRGLRPQENAQMYFFCFRHNVRTFKALLEHLSSRLDSQARHSLTAPDTAASTVPISGAALQTIRVYILWFSVNWSFMQKCIETDTPDPDVAEDVQQLWRMVAALLNEIYTQYSLFDIPVISDFEHLMDEEEATMGFKPVQCDETMDVWWQNGVRKPVIRRERSAAEVTQYDLVRIRDIYTRALLVAANETSSLMLTPDHKIVFNEPGIFSPEPQRLSQGEPFTPPPTNGGALDPALYPIIVDGVADMEMPQDLLMPPTRKRVPLTIVDRSTTPRVVPTFAIDATHDLPEQLPWLPQTEQDAIWTSDHPSVTDKTRWGGFAFAAAWYGPD